MKFTKTLELAVCLAWLFTAFSSNSQELTGNIVYTSVNPAPSGTTSSWSGFDVTSSNGGGYSGGWQPAYNPNTGTFMFGYNQGTVAYTTGINAALSAAGTGIQVSGLRYSWQYLNQDTSRGTLTGNISVTNSGGYTIHSYNYNMPQTTSGWTTMSGTQSFGTQYAPSTLGNLNVSFTGKDDRWWAGYYGPQIRDIDVRLQYSVAPPPIPTFSSWDKLTDENGEFTLTKTGVVRYGANDTWDYKELQPGTYSCSNGAWGRDPLGGVYKRCELGVNTSTTPIYVAPKTTETTSITTVTATEPILAPTTTTLLAPTTTSTSTTELIQPVQTVSSSTSSAPAPTSTTSATSTTSTPSATNPQPKVGEVTVSGSAAKTAGPSMNQILSIVRSEQTRIGNLETSTVQQATEQAQAASDKSQKESLSISSANIAQSQASAQAAVSSLSINSTQSQNINNQSNGAINSSMNNSANTSSQVNLLKGPESENTSQTISSKPQSIYSLVPSVSQFIFSSESYSTQNSFNQNRTETVNPQIEEQSKSDSIKLTGVNPLLSAINGTQSTQSQTTEATTNTTSVNTKVKDNDASKGGVSLTAMIKQPQGFNSYMNAIPDGEFYASKEIYRNQKTVDNTRALKQLSTDRLHQEMINQQYRK